MYSRLPLFVRPLPGFTISVGTILGIGLVLGLSILAPSRIHAQSPKSLPQKEGAFPEQNYKPIYPFKKPFQFFNPKYAKTPTETTQRAGSAPQGGLLLLREAEHLLRIWISDKSRGFDEEGRPWSHIPDFERLLKKFQPKLHHQAGYLLFVLSNFSASQHRRAAHFASFFLPKTQETLYLLPYAPYEPDFGIRREALSRMIPFLDHQLNPEKPDGQKAPNYIFDPIPFLDLCRASWVPDRILAFKILAIYAKYRPKDAAVGLKRIRPWIKKSLEDKSPYLRNAVKALIRSFEGASKASTTPGDTSPLENTTDCLSHLDQIIDRELPLVNLQGGLCEILAPQAKRMKTLAQEGITWIESGKAGFLDTVPVVGSRFKKSTQGLRLRKIPKSLQIFGLQEGDCITAINGFPIRSTQALAKALRESLKRFPTSLTLEWVGPKGHERARRYAIYKKDPTWERFHLKWRPELKAYFERSQK